AVGACIALALVARLATGFQRRALRLDAREQQQAALREVARALNASVNLAESATIVAEGALAATVAIAAIVELSGESDPDRVLSMGAAVRGRPPQTTNVPFDQSLTRMMDGSDGAVEVGADTILDRVNMPAFLRRELLHGTIVPVVSNGRVRGALAVVRPVTHARTTQAEDSYLGALMELASSMLWRVELVSQLRASEERFRQVADNIRGWVWLVTPDTSRFLYASPVYEEIWGRSRASLYRDPRSWIEGIHPDDRARVLALLPPAPPKPFEVQYRVVRPDGQVRWVWSRGFPVRDEHGTIYRMAGVTVDVTEQKEEELARERLIESRARLVRGFTHDVKNPLGAADGFLALLEDGIFGKLTDEQAGSVSRARASIHRALELVSGALELARTDLGQLELHHEIVDLRRAIQEVTFEYHGQAEAKQQTLTADVAADVPGITSDATRIRQIVANLLSNAIKYTPEHGRIDVRISLADERDGVPGEWVAVAVSDTGQGIAEDQLPKLFQEFTRLHPEVAGVGLGLAISQRLAHALGGSITVKSRVGEGSTFTLWLPRDRRLEDRRAPLAAA
ncbi:MAG TPA: ATP-binding protein, partial [Gemmatimonadaceae bacterium]